MTTLKATCSKCHQDGMNCKCETFHPNIENLVGKNFVELGEDEHIFNENELRVLFKYLEREFIPYEDEEIHIVLRRISNILNSKQ